MPELKKYKMFIGGEWVDSDTKKTFETLNPEDNNLGLLFQKQVLMMWIKQLKLLKKLLKGIGQKYCQEKELNF